MAKIIISEEMLKKANTYLSISVKTGMAKYFAMACVEENRNKTGGGQLPPLLTERYGVKQQYLMGVLAQMYLGVKDFKKQAFEMDDGKKKTTGVLDCCMSEESYDEWAESHVFSQINRFIRKRDSEVADIAYELMNDFKTFGIMLDKSIKDLIDRRNDPAERMALIMNPTLSAEDMEKILREIKRAKESAAKPDEGKDKA